MRYVLWRCDALILAYNICHPRRWYNGYISIILGEVSLILKSINWKTDVGSIVDERLNDNVLGFVGVIAIPICGEVNYDFSISVRRALFAAL
jgi:hypothetical protein